MWDITNQFACEGRYNLSAQKRNDDNSIRRKIKKKYNLSEQKKTIQTHALVGTEKKTI